MKRLLKIAWLVTFQIAMLGCTREGDSEFIIDINEGIQHDDFEYIVADVKQSESLMGTSDTIAAQGTFWLVKFKVVNHAKRVSHRWNNEIAYLKDQKGRIFENQIAIQKQLEESKPFGWRLEYVTEAQQSESTIFIFDLPEGVKKPYLMVRGETLMGDVFNNNRFEKTKVKLFK